MKEQSIARAGVMGHSMGGRAAMAAALSYVGNYFITNYLATSH